MSEPQRSPPRGPPPVRPPTTTSIPDAGQNGGFTEANDVEQQQQQQQQEDSTILVHHQFHTAAKAVDPKKMAEMQDEAIVELSKLLQSSTKESFVNKLKMAKIQTDKESLAERLEVTEGIAQQTAADLAEMTEMKLAHEERANQTELTLTVTSELAAQHKAASNDFEQQTVQLSVEKTMLLGKMEEAVGTIQHLQDECVDAEKEKEETGALLTATKRELLAKQRLLRPGGAFALPAYVTKAKLPEEEAVEDPLHPQQRMLKKIKVDNNIKVGDVVYRVRSMTEEESTGAGGGVVAEQIFELTAAESTLSSLLRRMYFVNAPLRLLMVPDIQSCPSQGLGGAYDPDTDVNLHLPTPGARATAAAGLGGVGSITPGAMSPGASSLGASSTIGAYQQQQQVLQVQEPEDPEGPLLLFVKTSPAELRASGSGATEEEEGEERRSQQPQHDAGGAAVEEEATESEPSSPQVTSNAGSGKKGKKGKNGNNKVQQSLVVENNSNSPEPTASRKQIPVSDLDALRHCIPEVLPSTGERCLGGTHFILYEGSSVRNEDGSTTATFPQSLAMFQAAATLLQECHRRFGRGLVHNQQSFGLALMLDAGMHSLEIQSPLLGAETSTGGGGIGCEGISAQTGGPAEGSSVLVSVNVATRLLSSLLRGRFAVGNNPPMAASPHSYDALFSKESPTDVSMDASATPVNPYADAESTPGDGKKRGRGCGVPPTVTVTTQPETFVLYEIQKFDQLLTGSCVFKKLNGLYYRSRNSVNNDGTRSLLLKKRPYAAWMWPYIHFALLELPLMPASFDPGHYPDGGAPNKAFCNDNCSQLDAKFGGEDGIFHNLELRQIASHLDTIVAAINGATFGGLKGKTFVDVGFGTGLIAEQISPLVGPKGRVIGTEVSPGFMQLAVDQEKSLLCGKGNVDVVLTPGDSLAGVPSAVADVVVICDVYHHFEYPLASMTEVARILKPVTGVVIIVDFKRNEEEHQSHPGNPVWVMEHCRGDQSTFDHEILSLGLFSSVGALPNAPEGGENYFSVYRRKEAVAQHMPQTAGGIVPRYCGTIVAAPLSFSPTPQKLRGLW